MAVNVQISSFQKRTKISTTSIAGTKISALNSTLNVSSGIISLDNIMDGGFPLGSLCLIEEDLFGPYAKIMTKYFLAEGAVQKNHLLSASLNENPWDLLNNLPSPVTEPIRETNALIENKEELKIAWRYENLTLEDNNQRTGNAFDLSIPYAIPETQRSNLAVWCGESTRNVQENKGTLRNPNCLSLLSTVKEAIEKWDLASGNSSNLLRVTVSSFGSPFWKFDGNQESVSTDFTATLLLLKSMMRSANAVAVVTIPHQLLSKALVGRSRKIADVVIQLKSLREDPHLSDLMDVHGILEMKKMMNLTSLKPILGQDGTTTYGFKATKRKFKIEVAHWQQNKLHLPPSVEDDKSTSENSSSAGCSSGSSKTNLDF
uniref:Elongator complex protein 4 n=1 Tax=Daphnia galeata TaxID=27404 RepID=A0A8J2WLE3_9CRUS|nr:unnamed protein product [Daphnia galeata]